MSDNKRDPYEEAAHEMGIAAQHKLVGIYEQATVDLQKEELLDKFERCVRAAFPGIPWKIESYGLPFAEIEMIELILGPVGLSSIRPYMVIEVSVVASSVEEELTEKLRREYRSFMEKATPPADYKSWKLPPLAEEVSP